MVIGIMLTILNYRTLSRISIVKIMNCLVLIAVLVLQALVAISAAQSGTCYAVRATSQVTRRTMYRPVYQSHSTSYACGFLWLSRCRRTHYTSYQQSFTVYHTMTTYSTVQQCCTGYVGFPPNCQAECTSGCQNGGTCSLPGVCVCAPGWTGANCETDINECNGDHQCDHNCSNVDGSYICSCDPGYELQPDNRTCKDVNECLTDNGGCAQICNNNGGSFQCDCENGYELTNDSYTCIDVGECLIGTNNCSQLCVEREGRYECRCSNRYVLGDDGVTCEDINECEQGTAGCNQGCRNTDGGFICFCNEGYQLHHDDPTFCVDVDECVKENGGCQHICKNNIGSYQCLCYDGHLLGANKHSCEDKDECSNSNGGCQHNCTNIIGSYYCSCDAGYSLDENKHSCSSIERTITDTSVINSSRIPPVVTDVSNVENHEDDSDSSTLSIIVIVIVVAFVLVMIALLLLILRVVKYYRRKHGTKNVNNVIGVTQNPGFEHNLDGNDYNRRSPSNSLRN